MHKCDDMSSTLVLTHQQVELVQVGHDCRRRRQTLRPRMITLNPVTLPTHLTHMEYPPRLAPSSHTLKGKRDQASPPVSSGTDERAEDDGGDAMR